jgi:hypothetical protein
VKLPVVFSFPHGLSKADQKNFRNVQIDAIGVGIASAAAPFLAVFLARLGASNFQVGLLSSMPALTGMLLAIPVGRYLQKKTNIVPWFSATRLGVISCYAMTGVVSLFFSPEVSVIAVLSIWAIATIPQTVLTICFTVVMNAVSGGRRYDLMSRRWSILGLTTSFSAILVGQLLDRIIFPLNYQIMFIAVSLGGLISYYFSSHIVLSDKENHSTQDSHRFFSEVGNYVHLIRDQKPFVSFVVKRFVYITGVSLGAPLFPLYFVRNLEMQDSWIALINTIQTAIVIIGYMFWLQQSRKRGSRSVLLWTTFGLSLYPIVTAFTMTSWPFAIYAVAIGLLQAGLNLVFFDELLKTIPEGYSATFISTSQTFEYLSAIISPLIGTLLADHFGINIALIVSGCVRLLGFGLFAFLKSPQPSSPTQDQSVTTNT